MIISYPGNLPPLRTLDYITYKVCLMVRKDQDLWVTTDDPFQAHLPGVNRHILEDIDPSR